MRSCSVCKKEIVYRYHHYKDGYICDDCLWEYEEKFHQIFNIWLSGYDEVDVSINVEDFINLVDSIKFNFNTLNFYMPLCAQR